MSRRQPTAVAFAHAVQDVEQGFREPEQVAEAVEAKVDQIAGQLHHLEGQLVLVLVGEPHLGHHVVAQVVLDEGNRLVEPGPDRFLVAVGLLLDVVTGRGIGYVVRKSATSSSANLLINRHHRWNFRPQPSVLDGRNRLLRVAVYVQVQHQPAKRRPQVVRYRLVRHAAQNQIDIQMR